MQKEELGNLRGGPLLVKGLTDLARHLTTPFRGLASLTCSCILLLDGMVAQIALAALGLRPQAAPASHGAPAYR